MTPQHDQHVLDWDYGHMLDSYLKPTWPNKDDHLSWLINQCRLYAVENPCEKR